MTGPIQIGEWSFHKDDGTLQKAGVKKRLESRAALVLALLCQHRGELITQSALVDAVWGGRALSRNSVAVVIADLRRALQDDARAPRYIETVPKRGYRLLTGAPIEAAPAQSGRWRRHWAAASMLGALLLGATVAGVSLAARSSTPSVVVYVERFANETQLDRYDGLSAAVTELVATELDRLQSVQIIGGPSADADMRIRGSVVLWDGKESVSLYAEDPQTSAVIWSGMAPGPEADLPAQVRAELQRFSAETRRRDAE